MKSAQTVLLGTGSSDLVDFAVALQSRIDDLHRAVDEVAGDGLEGRMPRPVVGAGDRVVGVPAGHLPDGRATK